MDISLSHFDEEDEILLDARVDQALLKPSVIKLFLGGTRSKRLPMNLYKLKGRVREVLCENSPCLRTLSPDLAALSSTLTRLDCSNCALESVPEELGLLQQLEILNLSKNNLTCFVWECPMLTKLTEIDLSQNRIRYFSPQVCELILSRAQQQDEEVKKKKHQLLLQQHHHHHQDQQQQQKKDNNNTNNSDSNAILSLIASSQKRLFVDLTENEMYFLKVANRGKDDLQSLIPPGVATTCSVCGNEGCRRMPHVAARFIHIGSDGNYESARLSKTSPICKFVPVLYPSCSAECTLALQRFIEWQSEIASL